MNWLHFYYSFFESELLICFFLSLDSGLNIENIFFFWFMISVNALVRDMRNARDQCDRALELNGELPCALMLLALISTATKEYEAALDFVTSALESFPTNFSLLVLRLKLDTKLGLLNCWLIFMYSSAAFILFRMNILFRSRKRCT